MATPLLDKYTNISMAADRNGYLKDKWKIFVQKIFINIAKDAAEGEDLISVRPLGSKDEDENVVNAISVIGQNGW